METCVSSLCNFCDFWNNGFREMDEYNAHQYKTIDGQIYFGTDRNNFFHQLEHIPFCSHI